MSCLADKWVKELPSITGQDAYEVSKYVRLDYWDEVKRDYEDFIKEAMSSNEISVCLVVGEWGLGKTSSFRSFVVPILEKNNCASTMIKARDYIDCFTKLEDAVFLIAERAIRALLLVINRVKKLNIDEGLNTDLFLEQVLKKLGKNKLCVFIDEFESVIDEEIEVSSRIIEGISSLINGEYEPLSKKGKYKGRLHLILSMTPQALSRFKTEIKFQETKGRMLRRIKKTIELRPLTRSECYKLLIGYLNYIYDGKLPKVLPFPALSILDSIILAGRKNPGYMILILNMLISSLISAYCPESKIRVANIYDLEMALKSPISWESMQEGVSIELDYVNNIVTLVAEDTDNRNMRDLLNRVVRALAIMPFPLSIREISILIGNEKIKDIDVAINIIYSKLGKMYRIPVIQFYSIPRRLAISRIKEIISNEELGSLLGDKLNRLLDYITRYKYESGEVIEELIIPSENHLNYFARELSESIGIKEEYLIKIFSELLAINKIEKLYRFNREIYQNVYPPPCPICIATKEKDEAQIIWREALRDVTEGEVDEIELGLAMISLIIPYFFFNESDYLEQSIIRKKVNYGNTIIDMKFISLGVLDRKYLQPQYFSEKFKALLDKASILIIFTKPDLEKHARELRDSLKGMWYLKIIPIGTTDLAKMLGLRRLKKKNLKLYESEVRDIIKNIQDRYGINEELLKEIIPECEVNGIIISRPTWDPRLSIMDIPRVYDYYIVQPRAIIQSNEVYNWVERNVKRFIFYGLRARDIPCGIDIESSDRLLNLENYLIRNDFLKEVARGLTINNSEIEKRIINFARERINFNISALKRIFVFEWSEDIEKNVLRDIYIEILKRKGYLIEIDKKLGEYRYIKIDELESKASRLLNEIERDINERALGFIKVANILVTKERGYRYIDLREFVRTLKLILESAYMVREEIDKRRLFNTIIRLKKSVLELYLRIVERAYYEINKIIRNADLLVEEIKKNTEKIISMLNLINIKLSPSQIIEVSHLEEKIRTMYEIINHEFTESEIKKLLGDILKESRESPFDFRKLSAKELLGIEKAYFFNIKFYLVKKIYDEINSILLKLHEGFQKIKIIEKFPRELDTLQREIRKLLKKVFGELIGDRYSISFRDILGKVSIDQKISFEEFMDIINNIVQKKDELINSLNGIKTELKIINNYISKARNSVDNLNEVFRNIEKGNINLDKKLVSLKDKSLRFKEMEDELRSLIDKNLNHADFLIRIKNFKRIIMDLADEENYLQDKLNEIHIRDETISSKLSKARDYLSRLNRIQSILREKMSKNEIEEISNRVNDLEKLYLEGRNFIAIEKDLDEIIEKLRDIMEPYLNPVTEEFLKILFDSKISRLSLREAVKKIASKFGKSEKEVLNTIIKKLEDLLREDRIDIVIEKR